MPSLAERLAPHLSGVLVHPGDPEKGMKPSNLAPLPTFASQVQMPKGMAEDLAEQAGLPHSDFALLYTEAWLHLLTTVGGVELVDQNELADLRRTAQKQEHRRNQILEFHTPCGATIRAMVKDFDTDHPVVPCELVNHNCNGAR